MARLRPRVGATKRVHFGGLGLLALLASLTTASGCSSGDDDTSAASGKGGASGSSGSTGTGATGGSNSGSGGSGGSVTGNAGAADATGGSGATTSSGGDAGTGGGKGGTTGGSAGMSSAGKGGKGGSSSSSGGSGGSKGGKGGSSGTGGSSGSSGSSGTTGSSVSSAADFAKKLGRGTNFLIGMGNDLNNDHSMDGAYTLGVTMDLHYAYLVGLPGEGGWPDWNANGTFVDILANSADMAGTTPMYSLYGMAAHGEGNLAVLTDSDYMTKYWGSVKLLFQRLGMFDKPAVVHLEPDFWGFVQEQTNGDPTSQQVLIHDQASECSDQPEDLTGMGHCILTLARMYAPKTLVGFHVSTWAGDPASIATFMTKLGAADADFVATDVLDRDAGCYEAGTDPNCMRGGGPWYWDETNQTSPNFHDFLATSKQITDGLKKPMIWWQIPFGVPSDKMGGTAGHYRDNRVHYIFNHIDEFIAAGGVAAAFGVGAANQTDWTTDGNQFHDAVNAYFASPVALP
jgi:hypothetical protein